MHALFACYTHYQHNTIQQTFSSICQSVITSIPILLLTMTQLKNINSFTFILFCCLLPLLTGAQSNFEPEVESQEFSYVVGSPTGPENWGNLNTSWILCSTGDRQSPINIISNSTVRRSSFLSLTRNYTPAPAILRNRGDDIAVEWRGGNAGGIMINGSQYNVRQAHWHIPSEHTINGQRFAMELHIVHANTQGAIAVIGVLYRFGLPDLFLAQFTPFLGSVDETGEETSVGIVNPMSTLYDTTSYYRYNGSLTTPPCSQNVTWTVIDHVKTVSQSQVMALQNAVHDGSTGNARPIQPLNGRPVYFYRPIFHH